MTARYPGVEEAASSARVAIFGFVAKAKCDLRDLRSVCPIAGALDIVGDRWTLLVLRDVLLFDRHLFRELQASPEGISTNTLSDRLRKLEAAGLLEKRVYQTNPERCEYHATPKGRDLTNVLRELVVWSAKHVPGVMKPTAAQLRSFGAPPKR